MPPRDRVELFVGGRGMGKTSLLIESVKATKRILVWDPKDEYTKRLGGTRARCLRDLVRVIRACPRSAIRIIYVPHHVEVNGGEFADFCAAAFAWKNCAVVVDELASVTRPGKAPPWWGRLIREGRHEKIQIFAATQRPTECDTTIIGNATRVCCFRLKRLGDRKLMAQELGVSVAKMGSLQPLEWLESDDYGNIKNGVLRFA